MSDFLQLIFLGAPGSGKGTQAKLLADQDFSQVSTGDLLRSEIERKSELGIKVKETMAAGQLVDDATVLELLKKNCDPVNGNYIFDGYPRNIEQAKALDKEILKNAEYKVVYFEVPVERLVERLTNRRVCSGCGEIYNLINKKPSKMGICDKCESEIKHREDDQEDVIRDRMQVFLDTVSPMLEFYKAKGVLHSMDATLGIDEVKSQVASLLQ
jgi:adenylate kinase